MRLLVTDAAAQPPRQATAWLIMTLGRNMKLHIIGIEPDRAWTDYGGSVRQQLLLRLQSACPRMSHTYLKRTARAILKGELSEFSINKEDRIEYIGQFFESIGVIIKLQNEK